MPAENRYVFLLCALLLFLVVSPLAHQYMAVHAFLIVDLSMMAALVIGVWTLASDRRVLVRAILLVAITCLILLSNLYFTIPALEYAGDLAVIVFCMLTAYIALQDVLFGGALDINRLTGAICVYLLIGLAWAFVFLLVDELTLEPAFTNLRPEEFERTVGGYVYYSFVTLTTLGYGDIYPLSPIARTLAYLEATVGQLYLTILVAALVGLLAPELRKERERKQRSTETEA